MRCISVLLLTACAFAQTAPVLKLSDADTQKSAAAYDALQKAQKAWNEIKTNIEHRYISDEVEVLATTGGGAALYITSEGWLTSVCNQLATGTFALPDETLKECPLWLTDKEQFEQQQKAKDKERRAKEPKIMTYQRKQEWINGFAFSGDFKYIVPAQLEPVKDCTLSRFGTLVGQ